jgi:hypothetical protein
MYEVNDTSLDQKAPIRAPLLINRSRVVPEKTDFHSSSLISGRVSKVRVSKGHQELVATGSGDAGLTAVLVSYVEKKDCLFVDLEGVCPS